MSHTIEILGVLTLAAMGVTRMMSSTPPPRQATLTEQAMTLARRLGLDGLVYGFTLLCGAVLALTGLGTYVLTGGGPMSGLVLMLHAAAAPPFAIGIALTALTFADRCQFTDQGVGRFDGMQKLVFWLILACSLVVILSAVIPMTPLLGTHGQEWLYRTHQLSSICLAILLAYHATRFFRAS